MTDYTPLYSLMREDFVEYDWMDLNSWIPRARAIAAKRIHKYWDMKQI